LVLSFDENFSALRIGKLMFEPELKMKTIIQLSIKVKQLKVKTE